MEAFILLGAPGSGKGTLAEGLLHTQKLHHISTGDMLRAAIKAERPVGLEAKQYMDKGELVPDNVIMKLVSDRLDEGGPDDRYLFDGFPRTPEQARMLAQTLADRQGRIAAVILLDVPREVLVDRLSGRRVCRGCGAVYHVRNIPPKVAGVCDRCAGELYQRPDDNEATVSNRLEVYERQTAPLISFYEEQGLLRRMDAAKDRQETVKEIAALFGQTAS